MREAARAMEGISRAFQNTARAFADFNRTYNRSVEIEKWEKRSTRFSIPRWRRWVARYVTWCLRREAKRETDLRRYLGRKR